MPPLYIVLVGLPGSGKSTVAEALLGELFPSYWLSTDRYIEERARREGRTYSEAFADHIDAAQCSIDTTRRLAFEQDYHVIHDQTNLSPRKRRKLTSDVPSAYHRVAITVSCDEVERQRRLVSRPGKIIPAHVDLMMRTTHQPPTLSEGFDIVVPSYLWRDVLHPWLTPEPDQHLLMPAPEGAY